MTKLKEVLMYIPIYILVFGTGLYLDIYHPGWNRGFHNFLRHDIWTFLWEKAKAAWNWEPSTNGLLSVIAVLLYGILMALIDQKEKD